MSKMERKKRKKKGKRKRTHERMVDMLFIFIIAISSC